MNTRRSIWGVLVLIAALLLALVIFESVKWGDWKPDRHSEYAQRAYYADSRLRLGMTRQEVKAIFRADIAQNPADQMDDSHNAYAGIGVPIWENETDLGITEPHPFWDYFLSADAEWSVRAGFDKSGRLIHHGVRVDWVNGP